MADTSGRILQLLSLLQSRTPWTGPSLATKLGVSVRTVRRDIDTLRELGYAVEVTRGAGGHYALGAGVRLPPLVFDEEQAVAIAVALQVAPRSITGLADAATRSLDTVLQVLPDRVRHQAAGLRITSVVNLWDLAPPPVEASVLTAVSAAISRHETLRYDYDCSPSDAPQYIEPHHIVSWAGRWCLLGWSPGEDAWRTLRLDLMTVRVPNGPRFAPRGVPSGDVTEFFISRLDRGDSHDNWPCQGSATVAQPAALIARYAPGGTRVVPLTETTSRVTIGAWSWNGVAALLGTFDATVSDPEPVELAAACAELVGRYPAPCVPDLGE